MLHTCIDSLFGHSRDQFGVGSNFLPTPDRFRHHLVHRINLTHQTCKTDIYLPKTVVSLIVLPNKSTHSTVNYPHINILLLWSVCGLKFMSESRFFSSPEKAGVRGGSSQLSVTIWTSFWFTTPLTPRLQVLANLTHNSTDSEHRRTMEQGEGGVSRYLIAWLLLHQSCRLLAPSP